MSTSRARDEAVRGYLPYRREPDPVLSGYARAALVCALCGPLTLGLSAVVGFGLGIAAVVDTCRSDRLVRGWGLAIGALMLSTCCLIAVPRGAMTYAPRRAEQRLAASHEACQQRLRRLHHAVLGQAARRGGRLPGEVEFEAILSALPAAYRQCPAGGRYRFLPRWRGQRLDRLHERAPQPLLVEVGSDGQRFYPHRGRGLVCLTNGQVISQSPLEARTIQP